MKFQLQNSEMAVISAKEEGKTPEGSKIQNYTIKLLSTDFENSEVFLKKERHEDIIKYISRCFEVKWSPFFKNYSMRLSTYIEEILNDGYLMHIANVKNGEVGFRLLNLEKNDVRAFSVKEFEAIFNS